MTETSAPPYAAYAAIMGVFADGPALAGGLARALDRDPQEHTAVDLVALGMATFKTARTAGDEEPVGGGGLQQAIGELEQRLA